MNECCEVCKCGHRITTHAYSSKECSDCGSCKSFECLVCKKAYVVKGRYD